MTQSIVQQGLMEAMQGNRQGFADALRKLRKLRKEPEARYLRAMGTRVAEIHR